MKKFTILIAGFITLSMPSFGFEVIEDYGRQIHIKCNSGSKQTITHNSGRYCIPSRTCSGNFETIARAACGEQVAEY